MENSFLVKISATLLLLVQHYIITVVSLPVHYMFLLQQPWPLVSFTTFSVITTQAAPPTQAAGALHHVVYSTVINQPTIDSTTISTVLIQAAFSLHHLQWSHKQDSTSFSIFIIQATTPVFHLLCYNQPRLVWKPIKWIIYHYFITKRKVSVPMTNNI